jgi:TonB family protein
MLLLIFLCLSLPVRASNAYPIPKYLPHPTFPVGKLDNGQGGEVTVRVLIHADGSVTLKEVVRADHPDLAQAMEHTIAKWRFEPWTPSADQPEGYTTLLTYLPGTQKGGYMSLTLNVDIKSISCQQFNEEIRGISRRAQKPNEEATAFTLTKNYLLSGHIVSVFVPDAERRILMDDLERAKPGIIEHCKNNGRGKYVDYLPEQVRALL